MASGVVVNGIMASGAMVSGAIVSSAILMFSSLGARGGVSELSRTAMGGFLCRLKCL